MYMPKQYIRGEEIRVHGRTCVGMCVQYCVQKDKEKMTKIVDVKDYFKKPSLTIMHTYIHIYSYSLHILFQHFLSSVNF
jgi:hypothetical protein